MTPSNFDRAFDYVCASEGPHSNDPADRGGDTYWGISYLARHDHKCPEHKSGVPDIAFRTAADGGRELARHIYRLDYWKFDGIRDARLAMKLFDIVVNIGNPIALIQRAVGVEADGIYGRETEAALTRLPTEEAIERLSLAVGDKYADIVRNDAISRMKQWGVPQAEIDKAQLVFLKGWIRRAIRRPPLEVRGV